MARRRIVTSWLQDDRGQRCPSCARSPCPSPTTRTSFTSGIRDQTTWTGRGRRP